MTSLNSSPSREMARRHSITSPAVRPSLERKPTLLPAFEPLSSSPFPRHASKRKYDEEEEDSPSRAKASLKYYPTPVPTSSTGMLPSSPTRHARPALQRTMSTLSERNPLCALPTVDLPASGEAVRMGRSSNSSDYQLSANRLISRVHVQATYRAPSASHPNGEVGIECLGWNGAKVHCRGKVYALSKGETFSSDQPSADIMLDVQDARVLIAWPYLPAKRSLSERSDTTWNEEESPRRSVQDHFASSPPPMIPRSPVSPSPANHLSSLEGSATFLASDPVELPNPVQVYQDDDSGEDVKPSTGTQPSRSTHSRSTSNTLKSSKSSSLSSFPSDDFSDHDEENDPIIHSFGPFGANILPRMASMTASSDNRSPERRRRPLKSTSNSPVQPKGSEPLRHVNESPIKNHVINQLAFSRLHSIPLSTIFGNLPADMKNAPSAEKIDPNLETRLTAPDLKRILDSIPCVGEINRQGKDAAGQPLENEFYYVPEMDADSMRREAVTGGIGGTGLRAVRKNHKQYYWKRPRC